MTDNWVRLYILVPAAEVEAANALAGLLDFDSGGDRTFTTRLSEDGQEPATFFGASTLVRPHTRDTILTEFLPEFPSAVVRQRREGWDWRKTINTAGLRTIISWE